jgi:hypothetical protein
MRGSFASCPRKFYWEFIRRIGPKRLSIHLHFGATFARGLEVFRKTYYTNPPEASTSALRHQEALGVALEAMILEWGHYPEAEDETKTLWTCLAALVFYFEQHPPYTDIIQPYYKSDGTPAVEFSFALPTNILHPATGEPILYAGRFDLLGLYDGLMFVVDEKTTSQMGPSWSKSWTLRAQFTGYVYAAKSFGHPVVGAIARGVAIRKSGFDVGDAMVQTPSWQIDRWWHQLHRDIERMLDCWREGFWDYNLDSTCTAYGGCAFQDLCTVSAPEAWVESAYAPRHWDPLALDPLKQARQEESPLLSELLWSDL